MSFLDKFNFCDQYIGENADKWKAGNLEDIHIGILRKEGGNEAKVKFEDFEMDWEQVRHFLVRIRATFNDNQEKLLGIHDKIQEAARPLSDLWEWKYVLEDIDDSRKMSGIIHSINQVLKTKLLNIPNTAQENIKTMTAYIYSTSQSLRSMENTYEGILEQCIYQTEDWDKKKELMPLEIDRLLEKSQEQGKLVTAKAGWNALYLAAVIGDVSVIDKLHQISGDKFPEAINHGKNLPLYMAILQGQYSFVKALCEAGADVNARNNTFQPIFHEVLRSCNPQAIDFCLNLEGLDLNCTDEYKNTALHIACHLSNAKVVEQLLKNPTVAKQIHFKDLFGRTPLDVALQNKTDDIICLLRQDQAINPKTLPGYGVEQQKIDQHTVLGKLSKFLQLKKLQDEQKLEQEKNHLTPEQIAERTKNIRDPTVLPSGGHCNGLSFLFQYYASIGKEQEFYHILDLFSRWDGTESSLKSQDGLKGLSGNYRDLEELMEQWINDIIWFQHDSLKPSYLPYGQFGRIPQFETIKKHLSDNVPTLKKTVYKFSKEQLTEWLQIHSHFHDHVIEITGSRHATSLRVLGDGSCLYYDPNITHPLPPFQSMHALAEAIQQIKYLSIGEDGDKMDTTVLIYKILGENPKIDKELQSKVPESLLTTESLNGYTLLHLAILFNDEALFKSELNYAAAMVNTPNAHGQTPLYDAVLYGRKSMVDALMNLPSFDLSKNLEAGDLLRMALESEYFDIAKSLLNKGYRLEDEHIMTLVESNQKGLLKEILAKGIDSRLLNAFSFSLRQGGRPLHVAIDKRDPEMFEMLLKYGADSKASGIQPVIGSVLSSIASVRDESFLKSIIPMLPHINELDAEGSNLLHYAVLKDNTWLVKHLLESGADLSLKDRQGQTALDLAKERHNESIIALVSPRS